MESREVSRLRGNPQGLLPGGRAQVGMGSQHPCSNGQVSAIANPGVSQD